MNKYKIGTELKIEDKKYKVIGYIVYKNPADGCQWIDYRLQSGSSEFWLSVDEHYGEYSLSWPANSGGNIGPEWKKVDEGEQIVADYAGSVDVDPGERAGFVEYEDETEEKTLSMEIWEDGTEVSHGYYLALEDIQVIKEGKTGSNSSNRARKLGFVVLFLLVLSSIGNFMTNRYWAAKEKSPIADYLKESTFNYQYLTSITGQDKQKAQVYKATMRRETSAVTKMIIDAIHGQTESVSENSEDASDQSVTIITKNEYAIVYKPESEPDFVYVQVSDRKYAYSTDQAPYKSRASTGLWYRSHYYSVAFKSDAQRFKNVPSSYDMYNGTIVHDLGNGYFDSYASTIRQSNIKARNSSGGGISFGK